MRAEQSREIRAFHPVHRDDVPIVFEEVLSHEREVLVRRNAQQDPSLCEEILSISAGPDGPDLERDESVVLVVERFHDATFAALAYDLEQLVPIPDAVRGHPRHRSEASHCPKGQVQRTG